MRQPSLQHGLQFPRVFDQQTQQPQRGNDVAIFVLFSFALDTHTKIFFSLSLQNNTGTRYDGSYNQSIKLLGPTCGRQFFLLHLKQPLSATKQTEKEEKVTTTTKLNCKES